MSAAISSSVRPSAAVRVMNPPTGPGRRALQNALQPQALFVAGDLARHAHVLERGHVDHVASRQGDVRSDARALLAQRLLGDLNDDLLAFLQQVGDGNWLCLRRIERARARGAGRLRAWSARLALRSRGCVHVVRDAVPRRRAACSATLHAACPASPPRPPRRRCGAKPDAENVRRARALPRCRWPARACGRLRTFGCGRTPPWLLLRLLLPDSSSAASSSSASFGDGFAQDHRLNIAILVLIEHRRGERAGLGRVFRSSASCALLDFFGHVRHGGGCSRGSSGATAGTTRRDPSGAGCAGASGSAFSGG